MSPRSRPLLVLIATIAVLSTAVAWQSPSKPEPATELLPVLQYNGPRYWKGNLHTHSFWSDGDDFPEMIADWYKRHGYQFLTLSDHNILADGERWLNLTTDREDILKKYLDRFGEAWIEQRKKAEGMQVRLKPLAEFRSVLEESGRFLLIPGEEITQRYGLFPVHMNAINLRDVIRPVSGPNVAETVTANLRQVDEQRKKTGWRTLVSLNHPNFGWGIRAEDMLADELRFFEVFNGHPSVRNYGDATHAGTERIWDIILATRLSKLRMPLVYALATDDAHSYHKFATGKANPGRAWVMVKAPFLSAEAIVRAMEAGDFYATSGVTLRDIRRKGSQLTLAIQPETGVTYKTQFVATMQGIALDSEPVVDTEGNPLNVTRRYSAEIGKVVAETAAMEPMYEFTGKELYVRARVISTKVACEPVPEGRPGVRLDTTDGAVNSSFPRSAWERGSWRVRTNSHTQCRSTAMSRFAASLLFAALASTAFGRLHGQEEVFRAGAYAMDIVPSKFPVSVNGGMQDRQASAAHDRLHARALILDDGTMKIALVVVDSCMVPRQITDAAKTLAAKATGIPPERILISATHTHTAPTLRGAFQSEPNAEYIKELPGMIAAGIAKANDRLARRGSAGRSARIRLRSSTAAGRSSLARSC